MEKNMEHEMETWISKGLIMASVPKVCNSRSPNDIYKHHFEVWLNFPKYRNQGGSVTGRLSHSSVGFWYGFPALRLPVRHGSGRSPRKQKQKTQLAALASALRLRL